MRRILIGLVLSVMWGPPGADAHHGPRWSMTTHYQESKVILYLEPDEQWDDVKVEALRELCRNAGLVPPFAYQIMRRGETRTGGLTPRFLIEGVISECPVGRSF